MFNFFNQQPHLTLNNHFEFGYLESSSQVFQVKLGLLQREPLSGFEESSFCAQTISQENKKLKVQLCLSGGIDSEAMLQSFLNAKSKFEIIFLRFNEDFNEYDIKTNIKICEDLQLNYKIINLDIINFFESGDFLKYGALYKCQSPQLATHMWLLDQLDGLPVLGGNPILPTQVAGRLFFMGLPGDLHCSYFRYFQIQKRAGVPWFFLYSPEQISAFLRTEISIKCSQNLVKPHEYTYAIKCLQYQQAGFQVKPRLNKFTGFEKLRDYYDQKMATQHGTGFDQLFRKPLEELNPFPEEYRQLVPQDYLKATR